MSVPSRGRLIAGWLAVALSTLLSCVWAIWGSIENFHEGWYFRELARNLQLMLVQYIGWMFVPMVAGALALWRRPVGVAAHLALAGGAVWMFGVRSAGTTLIAVPLIGLAALYAFGTPRPLRVARRMLVGLPLLTSLVSGAYPAWRVFTRPTGVDLSMRRIDGNGVHLIWAPAGPGWPDRGFTWFEAQRRCEFLTSDGQSLAAAPQRVWRVPTVDELVRTMSWRGANAGGAWDASAHEPSYRAMPDKEAPLWNPFSQVIYLWSADEVDANRAYRVVYNGQVHPVLKSWGPAYVAVRCVRSDSHG